MKTILLADDHAMIREVMQMLLRRSGFNVEIAENGGIAKTKLEQAMTSRSLPCLVISDIEMPGMTGLQLASWLKGEIPDIPILLMSSNPSYENEVLGMGLAFISKPPNPDTFMLKVIELIGIG